MTGDPLPTITEAEATGEIAEIYDDIRGALGGSVVNLIWRHFATIPGGLDWAWRTVRPAYVGGAVRTAAEGLPEAITVPAMESMTSATLGAAGVTGEDESTVHRILVTYERGNGRNLIGLSCLALAVVGARGDASPPAAPTTLADSTLGAVPPILDPADLDPETLATMRALNRLGAIGDEPMLGSLYRHLAYWPGLLAEWLRRLTPLHEAGRLDELREAVFAAGEDRARTVVAALGTAPDPGAAAREAVLRAVEQFRRPMIARMVGLGWLMRASLPPPPRR